MADNKPGTVKVTQTGSPIGRPGDQRATLIGLGLNKINRTRELEATLEDEGREIHLVNEEAEQPRPHLTEFSDMMLAFAESHDARVADDRFDGVEITNIVDQRIPVDW